MPSVLRAGIGLLLLAHAGCSASRPYIASTYDGWETRAMPPDATLAYRVFLIGDAGSPAREGYMDPLPLLLSQMEAAGEQSAVVFLGDNIYCCGLPDSSDPGRPTAEARLLRQLDAVRSHPGRVVFIPGNHDWKNSAPGGLATLRRQEAYVEAYLDRGNVFLPDDGFPGPAVVELTPEITLVALDTEWWLTAQERPTGDAGDYDVEEEGDVLLQLSETIAEYNDEHVLVVGHHPMFSNGTHAGRFPLKTHLFPLTELWENAYLPLPIVGSLFPLFIRVFGGRQDLAHPAYRALRTGLERSFGEHESLIYASGHEHSLQYFKGMYHDFIVSGGGARPEYVARGDKAIFYDSRSNPTIATAGPSTRVVRSDDPAVNAYNPLGFRYNAKLPQVYFGYNDDDGLYLGGGLLIQLHGFRKAPYAASHRLVANGAARTGAYNVVYEGHFIDILNSVDVALEASVRSPRNIRNFFGLGNDTPRIEPDAGFYQARFEQATLAPAFIFGDPGARLSLGGHLRYTEIENFSGDIFTRLGLDDLEIQDQVHAGVSATLDIDQTDRASNPRQGLRWLSDARMSAGVLRDEKPFTRLSSALSIYYSPSLFPQVTLASRVGGAHTIGDFPFYEANTIGGRSTVRGWRSNRFAGRTSAYANTEWRVELLDFSTYIAIGSLGALGFFDVGRVWTETDARVGTLWHPGYGGGLWVDLFEAVVLTGTYGVSPEQSVFTLSFGFLY